MRLGALVWGMGTGTGTVEGDGGRGRGRVRLDESRFGRGRYSCILLITPI